MASTRARPSFHNGSLVGSLSVETISRCARVQCLSLISHFALESVDLEVALHCKFTIEGDCGRRTVALARSVQHERVLAVNLAVVHIARGLLKVIGDGELAQDGLATVGIEVSTEVIGMVRGIVVARRELGLDNFLIVRVVDGGALLVLDAVAHGDLAERRRGVVLRLLQVL